MKITRNLVGVEACKSREEAEYAMIRTERAARRELTVVRSITRVEEDCWVSMLAMQTRNGFVLLESS